MDGGSCWLAFHQAYRAKGKIRESTDPPSNPHKIVFTVAEVEKSGNELLEKSVKVDKIFKNKKLDDLILCNGYDPENHHFQLSNR